VYGFAGAGYGFRVWFWPGIYFPQETPGAPGLGATRGATMTTATQLDGHLADYHAVTRRTPAAGSAESGLRLSSTS
jgi:hypothetical protein